MTEPFENDRAMYYKHPNLFTYMVETVQAYPWTSYDDYSSRIAEVGDYVITHFDSSYFGKGKAYYVDRVNDGDVCVTDERGYPHWITPEHYAVFSASKGYAKVSKGSDSGESDAVDHPAHYTQGDIEVIDYIDQVADSYHGVEAYYVGNILKYVSRSPHKNGIEDLRKAAWYLDRLIRIQDGKLTGEGE